MFAEGVITFLAVVTFHAWKKWCSGYTVADFYLCYTFTDFYYITGKFMSENDRVKMNAVVQNTRNIRSADTGISDFDLYGAFVTFGSSIS